ncbi:protein FAM227B isoform X2 [Gallus gallus]|nr:protein FAM227B isoform X2 [Gallus gallus]XP_046780397.1 protein FAM227B isoform X2 [Gallus gallus]
MFILTEPRAVCGILLAGALGEELTSWAQFVPGFAVLQPADLTEGILVTTNLTACQSKMEKPPLTFEEFLRSQDLTDWPRRVCLDEPYSLVDNLRKDCSFSAVSKSLHEHAPLTVSSLSDLEKRMNTCLIELKKHAETILSLQCGPASLEEQLIAPEQKIPTEQIDPELLTRKSEMRKTKVAKRITEESKGWHVESCNYPGFKNQPLELSRHLEASKP